MRATIVCIAGLLAAGCFSKPNPECAFACDPTTSPACPDGYTCRADRWCKRTDVADSFDCQGEITDGAAIDASTIDSPTGIDAATDAATDAPVDAPSAAMLEITTGDPVSFGNVPQTNNAVRPVTVRNAGGLAVTGIMVSLSGSSDYALVGGSNTCATAVLDPTDTCSFQVRLTASSIGTITGTATVSAPTAGSDSVGLTGEGVAALSAPPIAFGDVNGVAMTSTTITNQGTVVTGTITTTAPADPVYSITTNTCDTMMTVMPGQTCSITVRFNSTAGVHNSSITLTTTGGPGGPLTIPVTGTGV